MAPWLIPVLKHLPQIGAIISAAAPAFTHRKVDTAKVDASNNAAVLQQQIAELQTAVSDNAAHIKELAEQLQNTVQALEQITSAARPKFTRTLVFAAVVLSIIALGISLFVLLAR